MVKLTGWLADWACLSLPAWAVSMAAWAKRVYKQHFGCMRTCEVQLSHCSTTSGNRGVPLELVGPLERPSMIQELAGKEFWLEANLGSWQAIPLKSRHLLNSEAKDIYRNGHNTSYVTEIYHILPVYSWGPPNPVRILFHKMRANGVFHPFLQRSLSEQACLLNSNSQP